MRNAYTNTYRFLERLEQHLAGLSYRGVSVFGVVRIPAYMICKNRYLRGDRIGPREAIRLGLWTLREWLRLLLSRWGRRFRLPSDLAKPAFIFVVDHDSQRFHEMQFAVIRHFAPQRFLILTQERSIRRRFASDYRMYDLQAVQRSASLRWAHLRILATLIRLPLIREQGLLFGLQLSVFALRGLALIESYTRWLDRRNVGAILSLSDTHSHEYVITKVAQQQGIPTFTLQHGLVDETTVPVACDVIFAWGESTRRELIDLGVPDERIVVAGRPGLDDDLRRAANESLAIRASFCAKYGLDAGCPVVCYFATNWGPAENRGLIECFSGICDLPISPVVKLKPNSTPADHKLYRRWLDELAGAVHVPIISDEPAANCYAACDVLITCHSAAGVEALPFGTIVILVDLYSYMDLEGTMPHYRDVVVVKSAQELRVIVRRIATEPPFLQALRERTVVASRKYFHNGADGDVGGFIARQIDAASKAVASRT